MASKVGGKKAGAGAPAPKAKVERKYSIVELGDYLIGSQVWIRDPEKEEMYALVKVTAISGTTLTVELDGGATKTVEQKDCLNANVGVAPEACNDLSKLPHANEAAALQIIKERYVRDMIYVRLSQHACSMSRGRFSGRYLSTSANSLV